MTKQAKEILIVEDNEDNCLLAEKILTFYGFKTVVISHGKTTLEYCKDHHPDLILMDLSLPDIDGMELTRQLRQQFKYRTLPIIALSAHTMGGIREATKQSGLTDFLAKPFMPHDLVNIVRKYLS